MQKERFMAKSAAYLPVLIPLCSRDATEPAPPPLMRSTIRPRHRDAAYYELWRAEASYLELPHPYDLFFDIADLLRSSGASDDVWQGILTLARQHWRHETCQFFKGLFAG